MNETSSVAWPFTTAFEGTIATPEETITTGDPIEFEAMFAGPQTWDLFDFA